ncbi:CRISPR-associated protein Cas1 [Paraperlucidibaca baekdonensis]|uniref:CRISPR-associated endonuclease Cas1 n=1 Tax=Paraperlucidibaca baekdonensis TaxID=748120 RepID=A0A3E0H8G7_9GAMM|nr:type II CRISPR-associated endonuclease Cas1 [Paraperlucidibaca baekdonensis]REH40025.1 CRISPR-associated protein Cas1 [Paraperlucidibaca baekdonensis]
MSWRSVVISKPAALSLGHEALCIAQSGQKAQVPLEDIAVLVLESQQITLTGQLLSALADAQIVLITLGKSFLPNGCLLPFLPHSRALKVLRAQMALSEPAAKRLHQEIIRQKLANQAGLLARVKEHSGSEFLHRLSKAVRSGDPDNLEAQGAQAYFKVLHGADFTRQQTNWLNAASNYGYAVFRAAIARALVAYGCLPALGVFHRSEQNSFNLADDVIEPFRPFVDQCVINMPRPSDDILTTAQKTQLIGLLHSDVALVSGPMGECSILVAIDKAVMSLVKAFMHGDGAKSLPALVLPRLVGKDC